MTANGPPSLRIRVLGGFALEAGGRLIELPTRKACALVTYLACSPGRAHSREKLAALLWGDRGREQTQRSLRQAVFGVRRALPAWAKPALVSDARNVEMNGANVLVDAVELERATLAGSREALSSISELYAGPLFDGIGIDESGFEEWLSAERRRLHELAVSGLSRLAEHHASAGQLELAIRTLLHVLRLEPWAEPEHRSLMCWYVRQGRRRAALSHYESLARMLETELGAAPELATQALYRDVLDGRLAPNADRTVSRGAEATSGAPLSLQTFATRAPATPQFIGRVDALRKLRQLLDGAFLGTPRALVVWGDAGVGKSRLVEEGALMAVERCAIVVRGRCFESERVLPLAPWAELLRGSPQLFADGFWDSLPDGLRVELSRLVSYGEHAESTGAGPGGDVLRLFDAVCRLLVHGTRNAPVLFILDDLQWADPLSMRLLSFVARRIPSDAPFLLLLTARRDELADATFLLSALGEIEREGRLERLVLEPLSETETAALVGALQGSSERPPISPEQGSRIWSMSEGNPFVVVEAFSAISGDGAPMTLSREVPDRVKELISARFGRQSAVARDLIGLAATVGRTFEYRLLEQASGRSPPEVLAAVEQLIAARIFQRAHHGLYFAHDRLREVAYGALLPERRYALHSAVAHAIEALGDDGSSGWYGRLAIHFRLAGEHGAAVRYLILSADEAARKYGLDEALSALSLAHELADRLPMEKRAENHVEIAVREASCLAYLGRFTEIPNLLERQQSWLVELDRPELTSRVHFWFGLAYSNQGNRNAATKHITRAMVEADRAGDLLTGGRARGLFAYEKAFAGDFAGGIRIGLEAIEMATAVNDEPEYLGLGWMNLGLNYMWRGDCSRALDAFERSERIAESAGVTRIQAMMLAFRGLVYGYCEELETALELGLRAMKLAPDPVTSLAAAISLSRTQVAAGRYDDAVAILENLIRVTEVFNMRGLQGVAVSILADAQLHKGDVELAAALSERALAVLQQSDDPRAVGIALCIASRCAGTRGRYSEAKRNLVKARRIFHSIGARLDLAQARLTGAWISMREGKDCSSRKWLLAAAALFDELGLHKPAERARLAAADDVLALP